MKHKHYEVLIAIAEGKEVEFFNNGNWFTYIISQHSDPITDSSIGFNREWRVKKEPVIQISYFKLYLDMEFATMMYKEFNPDLEKWDLKITYQDGVAIKAELPS